MSKDIKFLEMSSILRTLTNQCETEQEDESYTSSDAEVEKEIAGTDESGINALNLSLS